MKNIVLVLSFIFSSTAFAGSIRFTLDVPEGASKIAIKAFGVKVDNCNRHDLMASEFLEGYQIYVSSTEKPCPGGVFVLMDLETIVDILEPNPKVRFIFSKQITNFSIEFE